MRAGRGHIRAMVAVMTLGQLGVWEPITPPGVSLTFNPAGTPPPANFGMQSGDIARSNPLVLYVGTCNQGLWKSTDRGEHWVKINTGTLAADLDSSRIWTVAVDPTNENVVYVAAGFGTGQQGVLKSTDGGVNFVQCFGSSEFTNATADVYAIEINRANTQHLLVTTHSGWNFGADSGVLESLNGGASWARHPLAGSGTGCYAFFLGQNDAGGASSTHWMLATQTGGFWRTTDSGANWTQVSTRQMQHGACQLYRAGSGALYIGASDALLRSTNNGQDWAAVSGLPSVQDGYNAVIGDGTTLYAMPANTGQATGAAMRTYYSAPESSGATFAAFNAQTFVDGPMKMACDVVNGYVYSFNWCAGVLRLRVR